ncbi:MAG TPA: DEAD/DEAH box helicase [Solirubrobacteraceae bacterium]|nr:DEAD/DEAH box helicase [Solirubrobacteraceae bacterium]
MELAPPAANVALKRDAAGEPVVSFAFPYDRYLVDAMRAIPGRKFDWVEKEWTVPQHEVTAIYVADVLRRWPSLTPSPDVSAWLAEIPSGWIGRVGVRKVGDDGEFVVHTIAGELPEALAEHARVVDEAADAALAAGVPIPAGTAPRIYVLPFDQDAADALLEEPGGRLDKPALGCASRLQVGMRPPRAELVIAHSVDEPRFGCETLWDPDAADAFLQLPGAEARSRTVPIDPWAVEALDAWVAEHEVAVSSGAKPALQKLRDELAEATTAIERSQAREAPPIEEVAARLGGELAPFQWAGVRYALERRRTFIADEQGLGKTVQALAALEADDAYPAVVVCPASLKLTWEREAENWLPHRTTVVVSGRGGGIAADADITIVNYEIAAAHREALTRRRPQALVVDESHYCKNPRAKRTHAVRRLAQALPQNALRLALTGTPVMNRPEEVTAQLRIIGRLEEFGSGARLKRRFTGLGDEERLHWHLRRSCFVRRLKADVLPQLPAKRRVVVPVALDNEDEYRLAEKDVIAWLREQPMDLSELNAKVAATLRAKRLAQIGTLKRLAARGKLAAAVAWIHDFLESGEPLIVFAHHEEVQAALLQRFPDAGHILGRDSNEARQVTVEDFQSGHGPQLLVCSTLAAGHGLTLTHASNVAFLELEWTPAAHDQAEDRAHRIGQRDAVTAWYLLAAKTIDETIAELLQAKRAIVGAVTDGTRVDADSLIEEVVRTLREGAPRRHLRPVA